MSLSYYLWRSIFAGQSVYWSVTPKSWSFEPAELASTIDFDLGAPARRMQEAVSRDCVKHVLSYYAYFCAWLESRLSTVQNFDVQIFGALLYCKISGCQTQECDRSSNPDRKKCFGSENLQGVRQLLRKFLKYLFITFTLKKQLKSHFS